MQLRLTEEIYTHKLTSLHPPERSVVQGSVDFPATSAQLTNKVSPLCFERIKRNKNIRE